MRGVSPSATRRRRALLLPLSRRTCQSASPLKLATPASTLSLSLSLICAWLPHAATLLLILYRRQPPAVDPLIDDSKPRGQEEEDDEQPGEETSGGGRQEVEMTSMVFASVDTVGFKGQGPTVAAAASPSAAYAGVRELLQATAAAGGVGKGLGKVEDEGKQAESSESSSIGAGEESSLSLSSSSAADDRGDGEEEVQSELKKDALGLGSMESLEECLPIKRGLSNCFAGKSKSFASLADAAGLGSVAGLAKPENPFNKRRRILMASKASWQRRASYAALNISTLRVLEEDESEDDEKGGGVEGGGESPAPPPPLPMERKLLNTFRSPRSFSLTDLQNA